MDTIGFAGRVRRQILQGSKITARWGEIVARDPTDPDDMGGA